MSKFNEELALIRPKPGVYASFYDDDIPCMEISTAERLVSAPLVSVKMITYNHQNYIEQAVESVACQKTSFGYEILLAEDGSSDSTFEICKRLQAKYPDKIRLLFSDKNVGMFRNSVRALRKARGKYIASLEGDDFWCDEYRLEKQVKLLEESNLGFCAGWSNILYESTGKLRLKGYPDKDLLSFKDFMSGLTYTTSSLIYRKDLWENNIDMFKDIPAYDTAYSIIYAVATGRVPCLKERISVRRVTGKGVATGTSQIVLLERTLDVYARLWKFGPKESSWRCHAQVADLYLRLARLRLSTKFGRDLGRSCADFLLFFSNIIPWLVTGCCWHAISSLIKFHKKPLDL